MSKPDLRAIVDVRLDWVTQNVVSDDIDCHQTDEWKLHQRGLQDCLLDRFHLCGNKLGNAANSFNWDFTACLFLNQLATFQVDDHMNGFNSTIEYCSHLWGVDTAALNKCAYSEDGRRLLEASHAWELAHNPNSPHLDWILVNGINHGDDADVDWGMLVCDAYTGPRPASCPDAKTSSLFTLFS